MKECVFIKIHGFPNFYTLKACYKPTLDSNSCVIDLIGVNDIGARIDVIDAAFEN